LETVGIVGTGEIGSRISRRLAAAKYPVVCFDKRSEALAQPRSDGLEIAASIGDLARKSDIVITCVTDGCALDEVIAGDNGLLGTLASGKTIIDTTSAEPWITQKLAPALAQRGISFLDAPVSGGVPAAESGRMNFMVGGDPGVLARYRSMLMHLGPTIRHVGPIGRGHTLKAVNMLALAAAMLATTELIAIGCASGIPMAEVVKQLDAGRGSSYATRVHFPRFIIPGGYDSGFSFDLMYKDLSIAVQLADRLQVPLFAGRAVFEIYRAAAAIGLAGKDNTRIVDLISSFEGSAAPKGNTPSLLENVAELSNSVVAGEALHLGHKAGIDFDTAIEVISAGSGASHALTGRVARHLHGEPPLATATLSEALTQYNAIISLGLASAIPMFVTGQAAAAFAAAARRFGDGAASERVLDVWQSNGEVK
jgi:3-hydroxyisobutyrate dehydrogenase-like beta-hydroxyacid dehydrogenase